MISLSQKDRELIDKLAKKIVDKGFGTMAILGLESIAPVNNIVSQGLYVLSPTLGVFSLFKDLDEYARILEKKENFEYLISQIEYFLNQKNDISKK